MLTNLPPSRADCLEIWGVVINCNPMVLSGPVMVLLYVGQIALVLFLSLFPVFLAFQILSVLRLPILFPFTLNAWSYRLCWCHVTPCVSGPLYPYLLHACKIWRQVPLTGWLVPIYPSTRCRITGDRHANTYRHEKIKLRINVFVAFKANSNI